MKYEIEQHQLGLVPLSTDDVEKSEIGISQNCVLLLMLMMQLRQEYIETHSIEQHSY